MATTTPNYGWDVPTSTDYVKDGATAIETLGDDIDATLWTALGGAYPGLRLVKKQTIGSGVSSVTVTSAFSATYEAYKIIITGGVGSVADRYLSFNFDGATSNYYYALSFVTYATGATSGAANGASPVGAFFYAGSSTTNFISMDLTVLNPFLAKPSQFTGSLHGPTIAGTCQGIHQTATSYTGFTVAPNTGTLTGGTIYVYGYGAS
jgi:hypothetical protein